MLLALPEEADAAAAAAAAAAEAANLALRLALSLGDLLSDSESESETELREAATRPEAVVLERGPAGRRSAAGDAVVPTLS